MKKVLVLGGSVFIGKALANKFIKNGDDVYVLNRGTHPCPDGAKQLIADRYDREQFNEAIGNKKFDIVIDGSAYTPEQTRISVDRFRNNVEHYIHLSTATVYKEEQEQPYREDSEIGPAKSWGQYSIDKIGCEEILLSEHKKNNFPMSIVRPFYVYGNENNLDRESYVFSRLIKGQPIVVPGKGKCKLQFGHIDDLTEAMYKIANTQKSIGEAYNVIGEEITTFEEWIKICGKALKITPKMILVDSQKIGHKAREWFPFRDIDMTGDVSKIKEQLDLVPKYNLYDGLVETASHYTEQDWLDTLKISDAEKGIIARITENDERDR